MPIRAFFFSCCAIAVAIVMFGPAANGGPSHRRPAGAYTPAPQTAAHAARPASLGETYPSTLWPKVNGVATVYYAIDPQSDPSAAPNINAAIATFNGDFPGVIQWQTWSPGGSDGSNYVDIDLSASVTNGQCEAFEGYEAVPAQAMGGATNCTVGTILHEMGHIIGLWHEQARPDASTYISLKFANVIKGSWSYFQPPPDDFQILSGYDYASLMQYPSFDFSANGEPVIETIPRGIPLNSSEGLPTPAKADYSAGDKETIERLYGAAPTKVTITSNPVGLKVTIDGASVTTPKTYAWKLNSTHTLAVGTGIQTLSGDIAGSTDPATFYYKYGRWSDSTAASHAVTVNPGNGELAFPSTSPQVATYMANFVQLVPFSASISPANSGQVAASPQPVSYPTGTGTFYTAREPVTLTAQAANTWAFYEFYNAPFFLPGGLGANPKTFYVPDTGNPVDPVIEFSNTPVYTVDVVGDYPTSNLSMYVDGNFEYMPKNFSAAYDSGWTAGSMHALSFDSPEYPYSVNSRFAFDYWKAAALIVDGTREAVVPRFAGRIRAGAMRLPGISARRFAPFSRGRTTPAGVSSRTRSRIAPMLSEKTHSETITLPGSSEEYEAVLTPEFAPATNFNYPPCGGTGSISPASPTGDGFYPSGQKLTFAASAGSGWTFAGWMDNITGSANPASLTANGETLVFANFNTTATPLVLTSMSPPNAVAGSSDFTLTLTGKGFDAGSLVRFNGNYPAVTYVSPTELQATIPAAYVMSPGNYQVAVENFPAGSNGCAVFGYSPFFVETP
jgi:hypothetical protein